jgi:hypothetical protein
MNYKEKKSRSRSYALMIHLGSSYPNEKYFQENKINKTDWKFVKIDDSAYLIYLEDVRGKGYIDYNIDLMNTNNHSLYSNKKREIKRWLRSHNLKYDLLKPIIQH